MAPNRSNTIGKSGNGELRQRKGKKEDADDVTDEDGLLDVKGNWLDSFIMLRAIVFLFTSAVQLGQSFTSKDKAVDEATKDVKGDAAKEGKKEKKIDMFDKEVVKEAAREQLKKNGLPIFLWVVGILTCLLIIGGEGAMERDDKESKKVTEDYYGTLGVERDAATADVKRAYKTLARRWHPDKNPNCTTCQETFSKIAVAMETLVDDKARAAYDETGGIATAELKSPRSVPLTQDNFDELVTYSNDVWIVQIFKPEDGNCAQFHPFWESEILKHGHLVRFGRVDLTHDLGKWLPVKYRVLPTILKFGRHLGSPGIFPITAMHETPQQLLRFVMTSFPNIGMPLEKDPSALKRWLGSASRHHKVLLAIPGKSEEERYKSHLGVRKLGFRWGELFEFRTGETSRMIDMSAGNMPAEIKAALPSKDEAGKKAAIMFFSADGDTKPKATALINWPASEDELVMVMQSFAELAVPALTPRTADLLCRSLATRRVYCLVLLDPPDAGAKKAMEEIKDSRVQYTKEVDEIRETGGTVAEEEDNFIVPTVRLFRRAKGLQPSISTCRAPQFSKIEQALEGANAMLLDLDTGRIAALKGLTSFRGVYPTIAYEDNLKWVDDALHPHMSLPDCDEGISQHFRRRFRTASILETLVQIVTMLLLFEALAKSATQKTLKEAGKWAAGAGVLLLIMLFRSPPFMRSATGYLPASFFAPALLNQ